MACIIDDNNPADIIFGCTDPAAFNYDHIATVDDGTCNYSGSSITGCMDPLAVNYNPDATLGDFTDCIYEDCPTEFTIRPSDGAVFYTGISGGFGGEVLTPGPLGGIEKGFDPGGGGGEPISIPLSEFCCTEEVVGQSVMWNGEFCVTQVDDPCPRPLTVTIDGVVIGFDGKPVGIRCCETIAHSDWNDTFFIPGNKPGACIDRFGGGGEICDLDMTDLQLTEEGTVVTIITTDDGEVDPGGGGGGTPIGNDCVNIDTWFASYVDDIWTIADPSRPADVGNGMLIRYNTTDVNALDLMVGDQISMDGFDVVNPLTTCYNLNRPTLNGYTTILDVAYNAVTTVITITTAIYITELEASQTTCTPATENIDVSSFGVICLYYGVINGTETQSCVSTNAYTFVGLSWIYSNFVGPLSPSTTQLCGSSVVLQDFYLVLSSSDPATLSLTTCDYYDLGDDFRTELGNGCWTDEYIVTDGPGQPITLQGELDPNFGLVQLLGTGTAAGGNYIAIYNVSIPMEGAQTLQAQGCDPLGGLPFNGVTCTEGTLGNLTELTATPLGGNVGDERPPLGDGNGGPIENTEIVNINETCCNELGNGLWTYIDGVCYWDPPKETTTVSIGVSENEIIVTDPECDTLTVCLSFFLEIPDDPECYDPSRDITVSLGTYSGDVSNDLHAIIQPAPYSTLTSGYCNWVTICGEINGFDGRPFKLKLNLEGVLECCEYNIFVDDISVSCTTQDSVQVSTRNDCPGFTLNKVIDNKKSWVYNDGETINRVFAPSPDADIPWRYTNYVEQSGVYEKHSKLVLNSKELFLTFNMCTPDSCSVNLNVFELIEYKNNFQSFWVKFIEQFVPATTIFVSGEKWCNKPEEICEVIVECDYDNNFDEATLGTKRFDGINGSTPNNGSINKNLFINKGSNTVQPTKNGNHGSNKTPGPILFTNFVASLIPFNPSTTERELTFPKGLVPLLEEGVKNHNNRIQPPIKELVR